MTPMSLTSTGKRQFGLSTVHCQIRTVRNTIIYGQVWNTPLNKGTFPQKKPSSFPLLPCKRVAPRSSSRPQHTCGARPPSRLRSALPLELDLVLHVTSLPLPLVPLCTILGKRLLCGISPPLLLPLCILKAQKREKNMSHKTEKARK